MTKQQILEEVRRLNPDEQVDLAYELLESVEQQLPPLTPELREELDRRIAEDDADPTPGVPWSELRAQLLRGQL